MDIEVGQGGRGAGGQGAGGRADTAVRLKGLVSGFSRFFRKKISSLNC
jgi:hypothetical protein